MTTNIAVMRKNFEGTEWKRAFAEALVRLWPDMNPDRADELSDAEYLRVRNLDPGAAARLWVSQQTAGAAPGNDANAGPESSAA